MKTALYSILFSLLFLEAGTLSAQLVIEDELVTIRGEKFIIHQVRTGETVYSITKKFKVDSLALIKYNHFIGDGLKVGDRLQIPFSKEYKPVSEPVYKKGDPTGFDTHVINSRKETPYFIARNYGITVEELYAYNPEHSTFKKGTKLRIPRWDGSMGNEVIQQDTLEPVAEEQKEKGFIEYEVKKGETLYSISTRYGIPESEILFYNPGAANLKAGGRLYLPVEKAQAPNTGIPEIPFDADDHFEIIVESGETLWSITRKYNLSEEELLKSNPKLEEGLQAGMKIKIPVDKVNRSQITPVNEDAFHKHTVQRGETLFGIASRYHLTIPEIRRFNPALEQRNPFAGEILMIPKKTDAVQEAEAVPAEKSREEIHPAENPFTVEISRIIPESCRPSTIHSTEIVSVALFLPLYAETNGNLNNSFFPEFQDTTITLDSNADTLSTLSDPFRENTKKFYGSSENYLQFYEGVLLAVDSMRKTGMNVHLHVYDTEDNPQLVRKAIYKDGFLETDLIIGPVSEKLQNEVAQIASKNRIPMISPLLPSKAVSDNPYIYQVNPDRRYLTRLTAGMVADEFFNSNVVVVKTGNYEGTEEGELVRLIHEKMINSGFLNKDKGGRFTVLDFKREGAAGLERVLSAEKENVVIIPTTVEGELSVAISNVNNFASRNSITLIASSRYQQQYKSIEIEQYHNLKMQYVSPFWTDYDSKAVRNFLQKFRDNFYTEPNSFGIQGYDVVFYFLNAIKNYGKDFEDCLPYLNVDLIQGNYRFSKISRFGGYINQGASVISYRRNYDVVRKRIVGL